jgi:hypothetical protein
MFITTGLKKLPSCHLLQDTENNKSANCCVRFWNASLREQHDLQVFKNKVAREIRGLIGVEISENVCSGNRKCMLRQ